MLFRLSARPFFINLCYFIPTAITSSPLLDMGVPGLWQLLEPSRRVVDLEQFRGKRMAIGKFP